jgi:hypothetical protein
MEKSKRQILAERGADKTGWASREDLAKHFAVDPRTIRQWNENWKVGRQDLVCLPFRTWGTIVRISWADVRQLESRGFVLPTLQPPICRRRRLEPAATNNPGELLPQSA